MDESIVDTDWLAERLGSGLALVDVRPEPLYQQAHLPGAANLPAYFLAGPQGGPPEKEELAARLGALGITADTPIVAYDDGGSTAAALFFWVMKYYQHPRVSVLSGGITKWRREGRDWEYSATPVTPAQYEMREPARELLAGSEDVQTAINRPDTVILDVRSPAEYLGLQRSAHRNGHIPGAVNLDWSNNLVRPSDGVARIAPAAALGNLYQTVGITPEKEVIVHCQAGGRSSETFLVLWALGYRRVRNYLAGWQEWGNRADTPVETE